MSVAVYPSDLESDVVLRDGFTMHLRPVREDDAQRVLSLFGELSERSLYYRFLGVPHLGLEQARKIVTVDFEE